MSGTQLDMSLFDYLYRPRAFILDYWDDHDLGITVEVYGVEGHVTSKRDAELWQSYALTANYLDLSRQLKEPVQLGIPGGSGDLGGTLWNLRNGSKDGARSLFGRQALMSLAIAKAREASPHTVPKEPAE